MTPKVRQEEISPLDADQVRIFLNAARRDRYKRSSTSCLSLQGFGWVRDWDSNGQTSTWKLAHSG